MPASACLDLGIIQLGKSRVVGGLELFLSHRAELHPLSLGVGPTARVSEDRVPDQRSFEVIVAAIDETVCVSSQRTDGLDPSIEPGGFLVDEMLWLPSIVPDRIVAMGGVALGVEGVEVTER